MKPSSLMLRKMTALLAIIFITMPMIATPVSAAGISVFVNGVQMISDSSPINSGGTVLAPASSVFQMFESVVSWDAKTGTMSVVAPGRRITIKSGESTAQVNGSSIVLSTPARTINGRLYIPVRFIADAFNTDVKWNSGLQRVTITGGSSPNQSSNQKDYIKARLQAAIDSLSQSVSIELNTTSVEIESLVNLEEYSAVKNWSYEGTKTADKIILTWTLELFDEHSVITAYHNPALESKLTVKQRELLLKCKEILAEIIKPNMSDYQKQLAIHDYIVSNCEFDNEASNSKTATGQEDTFFAYGALISGKAVCNGYVEAANILLWMSGIESYSLYSEDHSWNLVKLDDGYYHMDATWDDPTPDIKGRVRHDYFNLTDAQISQYSSHDWLDKNNFPAATAVKYNYFVYNDLVANNRADLKRILTRCIQAGDKEIAVMVSNHRTGGYTWDKDLEFIFGMNTNAGKVAKFSYSPPYSERDTLTVILGL